MSNSTSQSQSSKYINILRMILPEAVDIAEGRLVERFMEMLIDDMDQLANRKVGQRKKRIGVYGRYTKSGWKVIDEVMKRVSRLGFVAITGKGFYLRNKPSEFHAIKEIMSPKVRSEVEGGKIRRTLFYEYFVTLAQKAISYLNEIGTQYDELRGCYKNQIPVCAFIRHESIWRRYIHCPYLVPKKNYVECTVPKMVLCTRQYIRGRFCPFKESVRVPVALRELLLSEESRLIGVRKLKDIQPVLREFLLE